MELVDLNDMSLLQLRAELKKLGMSPSGLKTALVKRLYQAKKRISSQEESPTPEETSSYEYSSYYLEYPTTPTPITTAISKRKRPPRSFIVVPSNDNNKRRRNNQKTTEFDDGFFDEVLEMDSSSPLLDGAALFQKTQAEDILTHSQRSESIESEEKSMIILDDVTKNPEEESKAIETLYSPEIEDFNAKQHYFLAVAASELQNVKKVQDLETVHKRQSQIIKQLERELERKEKTILELKKKSKPFSGTIKNGNGSGSIVQEITTNWTVLAKLLQKSNSQPEQPIVNMT